jgi:hypothetical protein
MKRFYLLLSLTLIPSHFILLPSFKRLLEIKHLISNLLMVRLGH